MSFKVKDYYYKKAKNENFFARSIFKLEEIDKKFKIIHPNSYVLDLGYYPGSWSQYVLGKVGKKGKLIGVDIQEVNTKLLMQGGDRIKLFQKDIEDICRPEDIEAEKKFNIIISDMAPKTTGIKIADQAGSLNLVEMIFEKLPSFLEDGGGLVVKVFDSHDAREFLKANKKKFKAMEFFKPQATRKVSKEFFVIGKNYLS